VADTLGANGFLAAYSDADDVRGLDHEQLVTRLVTALHDAEAIRLRIDPAYQGHALEELEALVQATLSAGRDLDRLVIDILGNAPEPPQS
jgi:hypothetical protein